MKEKHIGYVTQVMGPVVDVRFEDKQLPDILNAITVEYGEKKLTLEVAGHIGDSVVRCIAMSSTDGLVRGVEAFDTGRCISVPVGEGTLGRIFNVLGEPIDDREAPPADTERWG
ncbi:MAG: F0F1 ATP synthase subunit beta, partial [Clostridia bacterium]|nr:F0F1 ATP synthase subunit beta [Clostridia bacterium]